MASCRSCSPSRNSPLRIFSVSLSTTAAERDCRGIGADCFGVTVSIIGPKSNKHHDTGNFASRISTLKNIEQSLENFKRHRTQIIKGTHNLQSPAPGLTIAPPQQILASLLSS